MSEARHPDPEAKGASDVRTVWDGLYTRALEKAPRPRAETDSVPLPDDWGVLPDSERIANSFLDEFLARTKSWLDLGCGSGSVLAANLRRFPHARGIGMDTSRVIIDLGRAKVGAEPQLSPRMALIQGDIRDLCLEGAPPFGLVYGLFSLQFLNAAEFMSLATRLRKHFRSKGGVFAGTVRSTVRSLPSSYVEVPGEKNTFISHEMHEYGMRYHHYSQEEIEEACTLMNGKLVHLREKRSFREYDPAPVRAWWDFAFEV